MRDQQRSARIEADVLAIRAEYAEEEAEAAEAEIAERRVALDVPRNLRIDRDLDAGLKRQAAAEQIPTYRQLVGQARNGKAPIRLCDEDRSIEPPPSSDRAQILRLGVRRPVRAVAARRR